MIMQKHFSKTLAVNTLNRNLFRNMTSQDEALLSCLILAEFISTSKKNVFAVFKNTCQLIMITFRENKGKNLFIVFFTYFNLYF